jgi:hypothetical protein
MREKLLDWLKQGKISQTQYDEAIDQLEKDEADEQAEKYEMTTPETLLVEMMTEQEGKTLSAQKLISRTYAARARSLALLKKAAGERADANRFRNLSFELRRGGY